MFSGKKILLCLAVMICWHNHNGFAQCITLVNPNYTVTYNTKTNLAEEVQWEILPSNLGRLPRKNVRFRTDWRTPRPRANTKHYTRSGYQRGHLCPSADFNARYNLMIQTYLLSNIVPMRDTINCGSWYRTEVRCRAEAIKLGGVRVKAFTAITTTDTIYMKGTPIAIPNVLRKELWTLAGDSLITQWFIIQK